MGNNNEQDIKDIARNISNINGQVQESGSENASVQSSESEGSQTSGQTLNRNTLEQLLSLRDVTFDKKEKLIYDGEKSAIRNLLDVYDVRDAEEKRIRLENEKIRIERQSKRRKNAAVLAETFRLINDGVSGASGANVFKRNGEATKLVDDANKETKEAQAKYEAALEKMNTELLNARIQDENRADAALEWAIPLSMDNRSTSKSSNTGTSQSAQFNRSEYTTQSRLNSRRSGDGDNDNEDEILLTQSVDKFPDIKSIKSFSPAQYQKLKSDMFQYYAKNKDKVVERLNIDENILGSILKGKNNDYNEDYINSVFNSVIELMISENPKVEKAYNKLKEQTNNSTKNEDYF